MTTRPSPRSSPNICARPASSWTASTDGFEAIDAEARISPDLIVLDRMLPGIDGIEACRRIRRTSSTPIILLTALGSEDERIRGFEAGADDYLTKPFSPRELVLRVQSVLRRSLGELRARVRP